MFKCSQDPSLVFAPTVEHAEHWALFRDVKPNALTDEELDRVLAPLLKLAGAD